MKDFKFLVYDLETSPSLGWVYQKYDTNVIKFEQEWELLSFSYKWLGEKQVLAVGQDQFSEEILVRRLWQLFDEADAIIAHNGDKFDQKMANAKFLEYGLTPPSPYRTIDTLKVARKYFRLMSNKLDDLGQKLGVGKKAETGGFETWLGCIKGDPKAWKKMLAYNKQDVVLLEKIYLKLRPWIDNHPPVNVLADRLNSCPKCGDNRMRARGTRKIGKTGYYHRFQCKGCGGWSQGRTLHRQEVLYVN